MNDRGQIVVPEDIRERLELGSGSVILLVGDEKGFSARRESDVSTLLKEQTEHEFWSRFSRHAVKNAWDEEDEVWEKHFQK